MQINFINLVKNILDEQNKTIKELFRDKIISENTFYKYNKRNPSLKTIFKLANYLNISLDYLFELTNDNNYKQYKYNGKVFYENIFNFLKRKNISGRKFCTDLNYSRNNLLCWKNKCMPSITTLLEITKYFDCYIDELLF